MNHAKMAKRHANAFLGLCPGLQELMEGRRFVKSSELTPGIMLSYLLALGDVRLCELEDVKVIDCKGAEIIFKAEANAKVAELKDEIARLEGTVAGRQQLFVIDDTDDGSTQLPLHDDERISVPATLALWRTPEPIWTWDASSQLLENGDRNNCMWVMPVMHEGTGVHRVSLRLSKGEAHHLFACYGVVSADEEVSCARDHAVGNSSKGWFISSFSGGLCGNGQQNDLRAGGIKDGAVLSMVLDLQRGSLAFFVDGVPHGPGYASGVRGPVRWATCAVYGKGNAAEILTAVDIPQPKLEETQREPEARLGSASASDQTQDRAPSLAPR